MISKQAVFGVQLSKCELDEACASVIDSLKEGKSSRSTALAVHGLIEAVFDRELREQINRFDHVFVDGQPLRWALNYFFDAQMAARVYGPHLMLELCARSEKQEIGVFFYGSTPTVARKLCAQMRLRFPKLKCRSEPSIFRELTDGELGELVARIRQDDARLIFVGLGCPLQEKFVARLAKHDVGACIAVGAAFDFLSGNKRMAPICLQKRGLEWLFRLFQEPRRLWRRYLFTNSAFIFLCARQAIFARGRDRP